MPLPCLLTILLAKNPTINPSTIHANRDISVITGAKLAIRPRSPSFPVRDCVYILAVCGDTSYFGSEVPIPKYGSSNFRLTKAWRVSEGLA
jgi:hypothetical protein